MGKLVDKSATLQNDSTARRKPSAMMQGLGSGALPRPVVGLTDG
jgi:hypothetical protein